ncbi:hypothetical protein EON67_09160 [archaeon]|nr:MAG: hypothetical protein EON67_09160 [archaeon]
MSAWLLRLYATPTATTVLLIDASTRRSYFADDDTCPLRSIGMLASGSNCWANVQEFCEPWRIAYDLSDARCWAPLFTPQHPLPSADVMPTLQTSMKYTMPDMKLAAGLESEIQATLTAQLRAWRPRFVTRVRADFTVPLRTLLFELEARAAGFDTGAPLLAPEGCVTAGVGTASMRGSMSGIAAAAALSAVRDMSSEHQAALDRLAPRFRVQGFPLHTVFTEMDAVVAMVRACGVHRMEEENVQYGLGAAVFPYPNNLFSVWVYVAVLTPAPNIVSR